MPFRSRARSSLSNWVNMRAVPNYGAAQPRRLLIAFFRIRSFKAQLRQDVMSRETIGFELCGQLEIDR